MAVRRVFITLKRSDLSWRGGLHSVVGSAPALENCYCKGEFFFPLKVESSDFMLCFNLFYFTRNTNKNSPPSSMDGVNRRILSREERNTC